MVNKSFNRYVIFYTITQIFYMVNEKQCCVNLLLNNIKVQNLIFILYSCETHLKIDNTFIKLVCLKQYYIIIID